MGLLINIVLIDKLNPHQLYISSLKKEKKHPKADTILFRYNKLLMSPILKETAVFIPTIFSNKDSNSLEVHEVSK